MKLDKQVSICIISSFPTRTIGLEAVDIHAATRFQKTEGSRHQSEMRKYFCKQATPPSEYLVLYQYNVEVGQYYSLQTDRGQ
jgi:hypothetical protein